jgi:hypothetical protein
MKLSNEIVFEITKEDRVYRFTIPNNAVLGEVYQVTGELTDKIVALINEHNQKQKPPETEVVDGSS